MKPTFYFPAILVLLFLWSSVSIFSQSLSPDKVITPVSFDKSEKLSNVNPIPPIFPDHSWRDGVIPIHEEYGDELNSPSPSTRIDPEPQNAMMGSTTAATGTTTTATVHQNFTGMFSQCVGGWKWMYPDPNGDVGPDHYMQMVNASFQIFDKNGNTLYGPASCNTLWDGFIGPWTNNDDFNGMPIVLYD